MVIGVIPWASKFNITIFEDINNALYSIPVIGNILGNMVPLGDWWFGEMSLVFLIASIIIGFYCHIPENEFLSTFMEGAKELLEVSLIIGVSRGITSVMNAGGMTATVLNLGGRNFSKIGTNSFY